MFDGILNNSEDQNKNKKGEALQKEKKDGTIHSIKCEHYSFYRNKAKNDHADKKRGKL